MPSRSVVLVCAAVCAALIYVCPPTTSGQDSPSITQPSIWSTQPDVKTFDAEENTRLAAAQSAVDKLVSAKGQRTIANTLAPYDEAVRQMNAAGEFAGLMEHVHPDVTFRDHATAMKQKVASASAALSLNRTVYQALSGLDTSQADPATRYYVNRTLLEFQLAGVDKDEATRASLKELNERVTQQQSKFERNIADARTTVKVTDLAELDGLPKDYLDRHKPDKNGVVEISTDYPDYFPPMKFARSDSLRRKLFLAFDDRGYPANRDVLRQMMETRYQIAHLVGYKSWADYNAADKMVKDGDRIARFISEIDAAARPVAIREMTLLLPEKQRFDSAARQISDYELYYLEELVRRSKYDFDSQSVRPYLPYGQVKQGILNTASTLFHLNFRKEEGAPGWEPDVETWDVLSDGKLMGRFYLDMHPRPGKYGHAEMVPVRDGIRGKQLPEAALVCNFPRPEGKDPGLMEYADVVTFFHEFGHLVHWIVSGQQQWAGISGISMEADFVEAPSQMLEEWMRSPQVLASFARHYETGQPIPADMVARMNHAAAFARGVEMMRQNSFAAISYDIYRAQPEEVDLDSVYPSDTARYTLTVPSPVHTYAAFVHLGGYSSSYYTYNWDKVIAEDFFVQFNQENLLAGDTPMRYRREVLEPGGSMSANDLVQHFLGRPQSIGAFQKWLGEEFEPTATPDHKTQLFTLPRPLNQ